MPISRTEDEAALLAEVSALLSELRTSHTAAPVRLDSEMERELGLSSLELAELLVRVEDLFSVSLGTEVLEWVETPGDLLGVVQRAPRREARTSRATPRAVGPLPAETTPATAATLVEALEWHVSAHADRCHLRILGDEGIDAELSYAALMERASAAAAGLLNRGVVPGDPVALMLPTGHDYFVSFASILLAGAIPVPIYPPARPSQLEDHLHRHVRILDNAGAVMLVTVPQAQRLGRLTRSHVPTMKDVTTPPELLTSGSVGPLPRPNGDDIALLQYTSGSTGNPKGVVLTHANLLANVRGVGRAAELGSSSVFVSWLPLYHDMGLIGAWLTSLYSATPLSVMSPLTFLSRPARWLQTISDHGGTISGGPNFGYELCVRKVTEAQLEDVDLSSWRIAFNGAEPVSPDTLERFSERFAPYGFDRAAITPVYGLAESTVGLTTPPLDRGPVIDRVDRDAMVKNGRAVPAPGDDDPLRFVACGYPLPGHELRIVDESGNELGDRQEGRIEFRGPSATSGYYRNPQATRELFHGSWLDAGDLGYTVDGELYVTGRVKDIVIRAGQNLYPQELEEAIGGIAGVRQGCVAVFASTDADSGTERLVILAETREPGDENDELRGKILAVTHELLGAPPDEIVLVPPQTVLKTSSGKIRRAASRELYESGRMGARPRAPWWQVTRFAWAGILPRLRRIRALVTSVAFSAYFSLLFASIIVPTFAAVMVLPRLSWRWATVRLAARSLLRLSGTPLSVHGTDRVPASDACVIVANHPSYLDAFALVAGLPGPFTFTAGEVFARKRVVGLLLRRIGTEFVERSDREQGVADTRRLAMVASSGRRLVFFPEGGLDRMAGLRPFHMGAFVIAAEARCPVVPVSLRGSRSMLRAGHRFVRRGAIQVVVGTPIRPTGTGWDAAVDLQHQARAFILRHCGEPDLG